MAIAPIVRYEPNVPGCVKSVVTDLAWIDVDKGGFLLRELAPGLTVDDVKAAMAALRVAGAWERCSSPLQRLDEMERAGLIRRGSSRMDRKLLEVDPTGQRSRVLVALIEERDAR